VAASRGPRCAVLEKQLTGDLKHLPLEDLHVAANARFGAFAGWHMPITYPAGVMKEHLHAREHAGLSSSTAPARSTPAGSASASRNTHSCSPTTPASSTT